MITRAFAALLCLAAIALPRDAAAQMIVESIEVSGQYMFAGRQENGVTSSYGPGGMALVQLRPVGPVGLAVAAGVHRVGIEQDQVIDRWNWGYWELQWRRESELQLSDPDFSAERIPVQDALMVSGALMPTFRLGSGRLSTRLAAGPSITYFARRLYLDEHWQRYYPEADESFDMQFRTYAEDKTGFEVGADARLSGIYRLTDAFDVTAGLHYRRLFKETGSELPLNDFVALQLGLAFTY